MPKPKKVQDAVFAGSTAKLSMFGKHGGHVAGHQRRAKAAALPTAEEATINRLQRKHRYKEDALASWKR